MPPVPAKRHRLDPFDGGKPKHIIQMRKLGAAARYLIHKLSAQPLCVDGGQNQIMHPGKMLVCGSLNLLSGGKMDIAIRQINQRAPEDALRLGLPPLLGSENLEDQFCCHDLSLKAFFRRKKRGIARGAEIFRRISVGMKCLSNASILRKETDMRRLIASSLMLSLFALPAVAEDTVRYALEKTADGYVRMDKESGEMSVCKETDGQLVCRLAADERSAYETTNAALAQRLDALEQKVAALEGASSKALNALPSDDEFDKTLSMMERFMRRFMGVVKELEGGEADPQKT